VRVPPLGHAQLRGGGRYLDVEVPGLGEAVVDLNPAYDPWRVYAEGCGRHLPPLEIRLALRIEAGERTREVI
jgi:uncharacterized protein (DUF1684 family)